MLLSRSFLFSFFSSFQAPCQVEQQLLTSPTRSKRIDLANREFNEIQPGKPSPTRPKVTFALQPSSRENGKSNEKVPKPTGVQPRHQNTREGNGSNRYNATTEPNQSRWMCNGVLAHAQSSGSSAGKNNEISRDGEGEEKGSPTRRQKFAEREKTAEKDREKENITSKFPKFGLSWVIDNTIHRGKRNQTPNKKESRSEEKRRKKVSQTSTHTNVHGTQENENNVSLLSHCACAEMKDYTISSIGVAKSNDQGFDDIIVTHRNNSSKCPNIITDHTEPKANGSNISLDSVGENHTPVAKNSCQIGQGNPVKTNNFRSHELEKQESNKPIPSFQSIKANSYRGAQANKGISSTTDVFVHNSSLDTGAKSVCSECSKDQVAVRPCYENSSFNDVKTNCAGFSSVAASDSTRAPLCDVIKTSADWNSEKGSDIPFVEKFCRCDLRETSTESSYLCSSGKSGNNVCIKPHQRDASNKRWLHETDSSTVGHETSGDIMICDKSNTPNSFCDLETKTCNSDVSFADLKPALQNGKDSKENGNHGHIDREKDSPIRTPVLEIVCGELLRRCLVLEESRDR